MRRFGYICALGLCIACSASSRDRMLHVFFDDPPERTAAAADTAAAGTASRPAPSSPSPAAPARSTHPPFEDRDCAGCHASTTSVGEQTATVPILQSGASPAKLRVPVSELCVECHDDKAKDALVEAGKVVVHSPVEDRDCTACHDPHRSRFESLLKFGDPVENLCFQCHEARDVLGEEPHAGMKAEERTCTDCHDPHAAAEEALVK